MREEPVTASGGTAPRGPWRPVAGAVLAVALVAGATVTTMTTMRGDHAREPEAGGGPGGYG